MNIVKTIAVTAIVSATSVVGASASTFSFDLRLDESVEDQNLLDFASLPSAVKLEDGGVTAVFDAKAFVDGHLEDAKIGRYNPGAGVTNSREDGTTPAHALDNVGSYDFIQITFNKAVTITDLTFGFTDSNDDFALYTDQNGDGVITADDISAANGSTLRIAKGRVRNPGVLPDVSGTVFAVAGITHLFHTNSDFRNDQFKLKTVSGEVSPVPLPAAGFLLLGGLGALGLMRRRTA